MSQTDWNARYAAGDLPWDTGRPAEHLVELTERGTIPVGRALEIGCGTGTNALWLASRGFDVLAVDVSPLAIERARSKAAAASAGRCRFEVLDFLASDPPGGPFQFIFDRGCFHVFDGAKSRARFAARVAELLAPGGLWLSLIGSTEGPPRETGPPRRSARDVMNALEPSLELLLLRAIELDTLDASPPRAWLSLSRRRDMPAQPSTSR
jgi:SAM-dependent methyltransferase